MGTQIRRIANILIVTLITLLTGSLAQAQHGGQQGPPQVPNTKQIKKMVANLSQELSLNESQETKISKLYVAHFDEVKAAMKSGRPDRTKMEAMKTSFEKKVSSVLTKPQQKLFAAYQKKNSRQQRGGQRPQR